MSSISELQNRLRTINIQSVAGDSLEDNRDLIKKAQKDQLKRGERKDGSKIGKYRNNKYAAIKASMNPLAGFGNVDLILTGAFSNDIFVDVRTDTFVIDSGDSKSQELFDKYNEPSGLGYDARVQVINNGLRKSFKNNVQKELHL